MADIDMANDREWSQELFSEYPWLYSSTKEDPNVIRIGIRMRDLIDREALEHAVTKTVSRYPYLCVTLEQNENHEWFFVHNARPVVINNSRDGVDLNSPDSNYHLLAFSWYDNWIQLDVLHALTDGEGSYEVIRTLLYYYCSKRYNVKLTEEGIRHVRDEISSEEWIDPLICDEKFSMCERLISKRQRII